MTVEALHVRFFASELLYELYNQHSSAFGPLVIHIPSIRSRTISEYALISHAGTTARTDAHGGSQIRSVARRLLPGRPGLPPWPAPSRREPPRSLTGLPGAIISRRISHARNRPLGTHMARARRAHGRRRSRGRGADARGARPPNPPRAPVPSGRLRRLAGGRRCR